MRTQVSPVRKRVTACCLALSDISLWMTSMFTSAGHFPQSPTLVRHLREQLSRPLLALHEHQHRRLEALAQHRPKRQQLSLLRPAILQALRHVVAAGVSTTHHHSHRISQHRASQRLHALCHTSPRELPAAASPRRAGGGASRRNRRPKSRRFAAENLPRRACRPRPELASPRYGEFQHVELPREIDLTGGNGADEAQRRADHAVDGALVEGSRESRLEGKGRENADFGEDERFESAAGRETREMVVHLRRKLQCRRQHQCADMLGRSREKRLLSSRGGLVSAEEVAGTPRSFRNPWGRCPECRGSG